MSGGISLVQAGILVTITYIVAMVLTLTLGPLVDMVDYERQQNMEEWGEDAAFHGAADRFGAVLEWFYGAILLCCGIVTAWFFFVIIAKIRYRRQEGMQSQQQQYWRY